MPTLNKHFMRTLLTLSSLLFSTALLLIGHGIQVTLLPLRGSAIGLSDTVIGLTGSAYFAGFIVGCFTLPKLIARVGHIRGFSVFTALAITALLSLAFTDWWPAWLLVRFTFGAMMCGLYTIIESWLNDQSTTENRGRVLASYTFITLSGMALGQLIIGQLVIGTATPLMLAAIFLAIAIVPVGLTRQLAPAPMVPTQISFSLLYTRSKTAFVAALLSGLITGSFWSLGAIFAEQTLGSMSAASAFVGIAIVGGALMQYPIGMLSDRIGRQRVLTVICLLGTLVCGFIASINSTFLLLASGFLFGALAMPLYALALATAIDRAEPGEFILVGSSVLLLNACGAVLAPPLLGAAMGQIGPGALWIGLAAMSFVGALYFLTQRFDATASGEQEHSDFAIAAAEMAPTSFDMDPRGPEQSEATIDGSDEVPSLVDEPDTPTERAP